MDNFEKLFLKADENLLCNTAYPVFKNEFAKYSRDIDIFNTVTELSYYIHVPFCRQLCAFCEYTRFLAGNEKAEAHYLDLVEKQIEQFLSEHEIDRVFGLDIGGGTPSALSNQNFFRLLRIKKSLLSGYRKAEDFEASIEISFSTINTEKLQAISESGIKRISAGFQSDNENLMRSQGRIFSNIPSVRRILSDAHECGIQKINLDLMYGMHNQTDDMIRSTIDSIADVLPEQITLYETRFNKERKVPQEINRDLQYDQYCRLYEGLMACGYSGQFGANTFSRIGDRGVSSYIHYRMEYGEPYKGFGIAAQSMSDTGISYTSLKNSKKTHLPNINEIKEDSIYSLPSEEIAAKYISIAMYGGKIYLPTLNRILKTDPLDYYREQINYLFDRKYVQRNDNYITLTQSGFRYYGAIAALFWSQNQQKCLEGD